MPLGPQATDTVQGLPVHGLTRDNRDGGVFGLIGRLSIRAGRTGRSWDAHTPVRLAGLVGTGQAARTCSGSRVTATIVQGLRCSTCSSPATSMSR